MKTIGANHTTNTDSLSTRLDIKSLNSFTTQWHKADANIAQALHEKDQVKRFMYFLYSHENWSKSQIARHFQLTRERVGQLINPLIEKAKGGVTT